METIYTIGHSNRSMEEFLSFLKKHGIKVLADVRSYPGSRWFPWFNREKLSASLSEEGIIYVHFPKLGGKGHIKKGEEKVNSLSTYEDHMLSDIFLDGIVELKAIAQKEPTAIMCAEADWQKCHRSFITDHLCKNNWKVHHIMKDGLEEHRGKTKQGSLF